MDEPTHVIDPNGEVIIVLRNANAPLPEVDDEMFLPAGVLDETETEYNTTEEGAAAYDPENDNPGNQPDASNVLSRAPRLLRPSVSPRSASVPAVEADMQKRDDKEIKSY
jgi:hypothetical protein